jgi:polyisoprenoid-binding protein YceI
MRPRYVAALALVVAMPFSDAFGSVPLHPIRPQSRIWFTGASNIRHFTCEARQLSGSLELRGITTARTVLSGENVSVKPSVSVSVDRLDCGIGVMNRHLREALQSAGHPTIDFRLTTYEIDLKAETPAARIAGLVTIAGVQRPVAATATIRADTLGAIYLHGTYTIRPTDFGVAPPRRFGGLLRVRDQVTVHFDVALDPGDDMVNDIACRLIESAHAVNGKEGAHASHS